MDDRMVRAIAIVAGSLAEVDSPFAAEVFDGVLRPYITRIERERDAARKTVREWIAQNAPGGWIDDLRRERDKWVLRAHDEQERAIAAVRVVEWLDANYPEVAEQYTYDAAVAR